MPGGRGGPPPPGAVRQSGPGVRPADAPCPSGRRDRPKESHPMDLKRALAPRHTASAHCDIPCGVYDPAQARIEAESCYRIIEKYQASSDEVFRARCLIVKEE